jgi:hypothetical protein
MSGYLAAINILVKIIGLERQQKPSFGRYMLNKKPLKLLIKFKLKFTLLTRIFLFYFETSSKLVRQAYEQQIIVYLELSYFHRLKLKTVGGLLDLQPKSHTVVLLHQKRHSLLSV